MQYTFDFSTCQKLTDNRYYPSFSLNVENEINSKIKEKMKELGKTLEFSRNITTNIIYDDKRDLYVIVILITCCFED